MILKGIVLGIGLFTLGVGAGLLVFRYALLKRYMPDMEKEYEDMAESIYSAAYWKAVDEVQAQMKNTKKA